MSQPMNFSPNITQLSGGELPPNSINLVYSPSCPHCHNIMPQYNQLPGLSGGKFSVNAVNLMDHYHELRAGGVQVGGVPQILIRGGSTELLEYNGPRMADSIAKEAMAFIDGQLSGGSTPAPTTTDTSLPAPPTESTDALLGGATPAQSTPALTGGKKRGPKRGSHHRKHHKKSHSRSRHSRSRHSRSRSRSRSRSHRRHRMMGGSIAGGESAPAPVTESTPEATLQGGKRGRGQHLKRWRDHVMRYAMEHNISLKQAMSRARKSYRR